MSYSNFNTYIDSLGYVSYSNFNTYIDSLGYVSYVDFNNYLDDDRNNINELFYAYDYVLQVIREDEIVTSNAIIDLNEQISENTDWISEIDDKLFEIENSYVSYNNFNTYIDSLGYVTISYAGANYVSYGFLSDQTYVSYNNFNTYISSLGYIKDIIAFKSVADSQGTGNGTHGSKITLSYNNGTGSISSTTTIIPKATDSAYGVIKVKAVSSTTVTGNIAAANSSQRYGVIISKDGIAYVAVPWTDSKTYTNIGSNVRPSGQFVAGFELTESGTNPKTYTLTASYEALPTLSKTSEGSGNLIKALDVDGHTISFAYGTAYDKLSSSTTGNVVTKLTGSGSTITVAYSNFPTYQYLKNTGYVTGSAGTGSGNAISGIGRVGQNITYSYVTLPTYQYLKDTGYVTGSAGTGSGNAISGIGRVGQNITYSYVTLPTYQYLKDTGYVTGSAGTGSGNAISGIGRVGQNITYSYVTLPTYQYLKDSYATIEDLEANELVVSTAIMQLRDDMNTALESYVTNMNVSVESSANATKVKVSYIYGDQNIGTSEASLPIASATTYGIFKAKTVSSGLASSGLQAASATNKVYGVSMTNDGVAYVAVPWDSGSNTFVDKISQSSVNNGMQLTIHRNDNTSYTYVLPKASDTVYGVIKAKSVSSTTVASNISASNSTQRYGIIMSGDGVAYVAVPWTDSKTYVNIGSNTRPSGQFVSGLTLNTSGTNPKTYTISVAYSALPAETTLSLGNGIGTGQYISAISVNGHQITASYESLPTYFDILTYGEFKSGIKLGTGYKWNGTTYSTYTYSDIYVQKMTDNIFGVAMSSLPTNSISFDSSYSNGYYGIVVANNGKNDPYSGKIFAYIKSAAVGRYGTVKLGTAGRGMVGIDNDGNLSYNPGNGILYLIDPNDDRFTSGFSANTNESSSIKFDSSGGISIRIRETDGREPTLVTIDGGEIINRIPVIPDLSLGTGTGGDLSYISALSVTGHKITASYSTIQHASSSNYGVIKVKGTSTITGSNLAAASSNTTKRYGVYMTSDGFAYVTVPWTDNDTRTYVNIGSNTRPSGQFVSGLTLSTSGTNPKTYTISVSYAALPAETSLSLGTVSNTSGKYISALSVNNHKITASYTDFPYMSNSTYGVAKTSLPDKSSISFNSSYDNGYYGIVKDSAATKGNLYAYIKTATSSAYGTVKLGTDNEINNNKKYFVGTDSNGNLAVNVPWTDTLPNSGTLTIGAGRDAVKTEYNADSEDLGRSAIDFIGGRAISTSVSAFDNVRLTPASVTFDADIASSSDYGVIKVKGTSTITGSNLAAANSNTTKRYGVYMTSDGFAYVTVPWTDNNTRTYVKIGSNARPSGQFVSGLTLTTNGSNPKTYTLTASYETLPAETTLSLGNGIGTGQYISAISVNDHEITASYSDISDMLEDYVTTSELEEVEETIVHAFQELNDAINGSGSNPVIDSIEFAAPSNANNGVLLELEYSTTDGNYDSTSTHVPIATNSTYGVMKTIVDASKSSSQLSLQNTNVTGKYYGVAMTTNGIAYVNVPWTEVTLAGTGGTNKVVSSITKGSNNTLTVSYVEMVNTASLVQLINSVDERIDNLLGYQGPGSALMFDDNGHAYVNVVSGGGGTGGTGGGAIFVSQTNSGVDVSVASSGPSSATIPKATNSTYGVIKLATAPQGGNITLDNSDYINNFDEYKRYGLSATTTGIAYTSIKAVEYSGGTVSDFGPVKNIKVVENMDPNMLDPFTLYIVL